MERHECYIGFPPLPEKDEILHRILNDPPSTRWRTARELFHIKCPKDREDLINRLHPHLYSTDDFRIRERIALALKALHYQPKDQNYVLVQKKGVFKTSEITQSDREEINGNKHWQLFPVIDFHVNPKVPDIRFFSDMRKAGVNHCVVLATDTDPCDIDRPEISDTIESAYKKSTQSKMMPFDNLKQYIRECLSSSTHVSNQDVADWVSDYPDKLTGFGSVNLSKDRSYVENKLRRIADLGMKGINLLPHLQFFNPSENKNLDLVLEFCSDLRMILLSHSACGGGPFEIMELCRNAHPSLWEPHLKKYPDVYLVMAHFGAYTTKMPGIWLYEALQLGKKYKNVYAELSYVDWILNRDCLVNEIRKTIGFDRVLFASGYPQAMLSGLNTACIVGSIKANLYMTEKEKCKVLGKNSAKLLNLH